MSFKKSLGTALKFYDKNNFLGSIFLYISIVFLQIIYPLNIEDLVNILDALKNINL